jgi:caffeoyl-CoA O-methyltransferase
MNKKITQDFLKSHRDNWREHNVPESDGKLLHDIIIKNNYKYALEIGTSTGHSGIWIAWALSITGGKLTTIEINEIRYRNALNNISEAGVSEYINPLFGDAFQIIKDLSGPFDFIFCDADKDRYIKYFDELFPKLIAGGCYLVHNVFESNPKRNFRSKGIPEFVDYIKSLDSMVTSFNTEGGGISISYKIR